ncbi:MULTISPECIES: flippase [Raoultella]|jgi:O-antigen/teichoic acid export membrane protein|nr:MULTISPECIES: flippase [Raoultella]MCC2039440.1 flippase [Raoultella ornithinolytica]MCC2043496.1 flippase [Raoultella ornithinolytica]MCC2048480.1 flippase [Raoultella ornithinolytica]MCC2053974.1 flippase [Raoultella ornithinolytica]MCC2065781.1 flippase [Raoultella ornithinolytica]
MKIINKAIKSKSIINVVWLSADSLIRMGLGFIISVWLARYLGPQDFGIYNYCLAIITIYVSVASLGMNGVVVREIIKNEGNANVIMGTSFFLQIAGSILSCLFVIVTIFLLRPDDWGIMLASLVMLPSVLLRSSDIFKYWFESKISSKYTVFSQNIAFFVSSAVKLLIIFTGGSYVYVCATVSIEALVTAVLLTYFFKKHGLSSKWVFNLSEAKRLLSLSWPLIISGVAFMLYMRIDQIMIGNMIDDATVGIYSVAVKMVEVWYFFPVAIVSSLFPKIIKIREINIDEYNKRIQFLYDLLVLISVSIALFVTFLSDYIISFFYTSQYLEASLLIKIYAWVSVFYFLSSASGRWYINEGLQKYALNRNVIGLFMGVVLNYILIPIYGALGSVYATLIAYACAGYLFDILSSQTRIAFYQKSKALWLPGSFMRLLKGFR